MGRQSLPIVDRPATSVLPSDDSDPIPMLARGQSGTPGWLSDAQGRHLRYLRLSVTDRCDLRCQYCMPEEGAPASPRSELLSFEEIGRVVRMFRALGVETVRLTGGEPLLRKNLHQLVKMIRDEGIEDIALTTNATLLAKNAERLRQSGLTRLNISLDSVDAETFRVLTRGGRLDRVIEGIEVAREVGFDVIKTNTVVVRGHNEDQLPEIVEWAWARDIVPRFIELMPLGAGAGAALGGGAVFSVEDMKRRLSALVQPEDPVAYPSGQGRGPAGYLLAKSGSGHKVGFIGAVTENFCERCNRVRITAMGQIRACLASPEGLFLRPLLREHAADDALLAAVEGSLFGKRSGHRFEVSGESHLGVAMSGVGG